jgi:hypothetical protein
MSKKENLAGILQAMLAEISVLETYFPDGKRETSGNYEQWAPKDLIAHAAEWTKRQVRLLADLQTPDGMEENGDVNRIIFERYRDTPWNEVVANLEDGLKAMLQEVDRLAEDAFTAVDPHGGGRNPAWVGIAYYGIAHSLIHIAQALVRADNPEAAIGLQRRMTSPLLSIDSSAAWKGDVELYLARVLSISGSHDEAISQYNKAITDSPGLIQHAANEPDLEAIRERI